MALIGEGSYGCIYKPALKCKNKFGIEGTNTVSKLFEDDTEFKSQTRVNQTVKSIDPKNLFTVPVYGTCTVNKTNIRFKCGHTSNQRMNYEQIIYGYGGTSLMDIMKNKPGNYKKFKKIFLMMGPILNGISKLIDRNLIHGDIKPDNIVIRGNRAYLIDFGLMMLGNELFSSSKSTILNYDYPYYSPDYKLFLAKNFREYRKKFLQNFNYTFYFINCSVNLQNIWDDLEIDIEMGLKNLWKSRKIGPDYGRQDTWSIGILFYLIWSWSKCISTSDSHEASNHKVKKFIGKILNFNKRIDIGSLILEYNEICTALKHNK